MMKMVKLHILWSSESSDYLTHRKGSEKCTPVEVHLLLVSFPALLAQYNRAAQTPLILGAFYSSISGDRKSRFGLFC